MALSPAVLNELRAELNHIEALRKQINERLDARARAIQAVLEPFDVGQVQLPLAISTTDAPELTIGYVAAKFASTGLRAAILDVLATYGPLRAPEIAKILERNGFKNESKTPLPTRVYNDLWRLSAEGGAVEKKEGVFSLKRTG